ncbi:MAG: fibronectin type III domain-containing protein, partial [candidate division Zixibacteria bacterium]|nr:fibronectin type III domain-containing protein [candidate division Zixibacteria bacterium]
MYIRVCLSALAMILAILMIGCSDDDDNSVDSPNAPSIPTNLRAVGTYGNIHLTWDASSGGGLIGYNVDRSTDGVNFAQRNGDPIPITEFDDTYLEDGVVYYYRVTADGESESAPSNIVREIHGTRLDPLYSSGLVVAAGVANPYVVEDTVVINGGGIEVQTGAELYVKEGAVIDIEYSDITTSALKVYGLLRVVATPDSTAKLTSHKTSGSLADGEGCRLRFESAVDYDAVEDTGCLVQNMEIVNLQDGNQAIDVLNCSPRFYNCKITANKVSGGSYFEIRGSSAPVIENCSVNNMVITVRTDLRSTLAMIRKNICRDGYYSIYFSGQDNPAVTPGQVVDNDFDGTVNGLYLL